jgi:hypothetical protein
MSKPSFIFQKNSIFLIVLFCFILLTLFSSTLPDGLEWAAEKLGFINKETETITSPFADYSISESLSPKTNRLLSALFGATLLVGITVSIMVWLKRGTHPK